MLEPLRQFICDNCGKIITPPKEGVVEWLEEGDSTMYNSQYGFKIVHYNQKCYFYPDPKYPNSMSIPLEYFLGEKGYICILSFLDTGPLIMEKYKGPRVKNMREFVELMRRLTLPYYEEARLYFGNLRADDDFELDSPIYEQDNLKKIIQKYGKEQA